MNPKKYKEGDLWTDAREHWPEDARGPDPRVRSFRFVVNSWNYLDDVTDPFSDNTKKMWCKTFKTAQAAFNAYHARVKRDETQRCEVCMRIEYGCIWQTAPKVPMPMFGGETFVYLIRWRADGAFTETYHVNERKFGERSKRCVDELSRTRDTPGLMTHYVKKAKINK